MQFTLCAITAKINPHYVLLDAILKLPHRPQNSPSFTSGFQGYENKQIYTN